MKIGILFTAYNCDSYIEEVLSPWIKLRDELNLVLVANSGMFSDYIKLGFEEKNKKTLQSLIDSKLDFLVTTSGKNLLDENSSRNTCLDYIKKINCDLVWTVDGDEIYTEEQIRRIINYIIGKPEPDVYLIQFKNYTLEHPYWVDGFSKETIYWTNRYGGINEFFFDNVVNYKDGTKITETNNQDKIEKSVAFIEHYSWLSSDSRSREKVDYQNSRLFGRENERCAFSYKENGDLNFNDQFWISRGLQIPILHETLSIHSTESELDYSWKDEIIYINNCKSSKNYYFEVWNSKSDLLHSTEMNLLAGINFFIYPGSTKDDRFLKIVVKDKDVICHEEKLISSI